MKLAVVGSVYVRLSITILLSLNHEIISLEIVSQRTDLINQRISLITEVELKEYLKTKTLNLKATLNKKEAYTGANFLIIAKATDHDNATNYFNTGSVEVLARDVMAINYGLVMVIKSTIPVGFVEQLCKKLSFRSTNFSPELLHEGRALYDNLHPSRIVVGEQSERGKILADLLKEGAIYKNILTLFINSIEAKVIKLFANNYLVMRVAYFNELDTYLAINGLDTLKIIEGVNSDTHIGAQYNSPWFGYAGYGLPKDTRQLLANYQDVPQNLMQDIENLNATLNKKFTQDTVTSRVRSRLLINESNNLIL